MPNRLYLSLLLLTIVCLSPAVPARCQAPPIQWQHCYGGSAAEYCYAARQTYDSGYVAAGSTASADRSITGYHGNTDAWVIKLSDTGALQWQIAIGGSDKDVAVRVLQTLDSGYIVAGSTRSADGDITFHHGGWDAWVIKLSKTGHIQWQKTYGGTRDDFGADIRQTADSGYILAAYSSSNDGDLPRHVGTTATADYWILKLSPAGVVQWQRVLGGTADDYATGVQQTRDGNYLVCGYTLSADSDVTGNHGGEDFWIVKLSSAGALLWETSLGGSGSDFANSVTEGRDGSYIVAGGSNSTNGDITGNLGMGDGWLVKLSATGALVWQRSLGGDADDAINSVQPTADSGYLISGYISSHIDGTFRGSADYWLVKLSAAGAVQWQRCMGSLGNDVGWCAMPTADDGYIMAGNSFYTGNGDVGFDQGVGGIDFWIVKLREPVVNAVPGVTGNNVITLSPNPASGYLYVTGITDATLTVCNTLGQHLALAAHATHVSLASLPAGIYLVRVYDANGMLVKMERVVKE